MQDMQEGFAVYMGMLGGRIVQSKLLEQHLVLFLGVRGLVRIMPEPKYDETSLPKPERVSTEEICLYGSTVLVRFNTC